MITSKGRREGGTHDPGGAAPVKHRPGAWPEALQASVCSTLPSGFEPGSAAWLELQAERAEQIVIVGRIGAYMEAEPSPRAVREFSRRWATRIGQLAETIAAEKAKEAKR